MYTGIHDIILVSVKWNSPHNLYIHVAYMYNSKQEIKIIIDFRNFRIKEIILDIILIIKIILQQFNKELDGKVISCTSI